MARSEANNYISPPSRQWEFKVMGVDGKETWTKETDLPPEQVNAFVQNRPRWLKKREDEAEEAKEAGAIQEKKDRGKRRRKAEATDEAI